MHLDIITTHQPSKLVPPISNNLQLASGLELLRDRLPNSDQKIFINRLPTSNSRFALTALSSLNHTAKES